MFTLRKSVSLIFILMFMSLSLIFIVFNFPIKFGFASVEEAVLSVQINNLKSPVEPEIFEVSDGSYISVSGGKMYNKF